MESEIASEHIPFIRIYKDGHVERLSGTETIPSSLNPQNGVVSKDVLYSPEHNLSVRLFLPHNSSAAADDEKLPLLIYIHGGAWIIESPFSPLYHNYVAEIVRSANCLAVSIQYRRAPEYPIPAAYEDSWSAIQWIFSHSNGGSNGSDDWINENADFDRVFVAGDSAGGNITHHMAIRAGKEKLEARIKGIAIVHPAFWGREPVDEQDVQDSETRKGIARVWEKIASPNSVNGADDPLFNVVGTGSDFSGLGCEKVLVGVAGKDVFGRQGLAYAAKLKKSLYEGDVEVVLEEEEEHCFHLSNIESKNASNKFMKKFVEFITTC
ncbi:unnamed protein product [Cochlearia groenlandica]